MVSVLASSAEDPKVYEIGIYKKKNNSLQKTTEKLKIEQHEPLLK
jgi:hypothetical protein